MIFERLVHIIDARSLADVAVARKSLKLIGRFEHSVEMTDQQHFLATVAIETADKMNAARGQIIADLLEPSTADDSEALP